MRGDEHEAARLRDEAGRLRRLAVRAELGVNPGSVRFRSAFRFQAPGERAGLADEGQFKDYHATLSLVMKRPVYRRREAAPERKIHVVVDVRESDDPEQGARVAEAARLAGGMALFTPGASVTLTAFGVAGVVPLSAFRGEGDWPWLTRVTERLGRLRAEPRLGAGAFRRACFGSDEPAFVCVVSTWVEPDWVASLTMPLGGQLVLVEPAAGAFGQEGGAMTHPLLALLPNAAARNRIEERGEALALACRRARIDVAAIPPGGRVLDRLESAAAARAPGHG